MKPYLFFIFSMLVTVLLAGTFGGCKTVKTKAEVQTDVQTTANLDVKSAAISVQSKIATETNVDKSSLAEVTEWNTNIKTYSVPDSTGKQYTTSESNTTGKTTMGKKNDINTSKKDSSNVSSQTNVKDNSKLLQSTSSKTTENKKEEVKSPVWISLGIILVIAGLLFLVFLVLKRYKIIK